MTQHGVLDPPGRRIRLDGPVNFRDLGGYRSAIDGRTVRWRVVFRADGLDVMTDDDLHVITNQLGVRTIIDLRTEREIEIVGVGPLSDADVVRHHLSIIDETQPAWREAMEDGDIVAQYFVMLEGSSHKFIDALHVIAATDAPLVFHCAAGKDRTGLLAALLLSLLGVTDDQIGHDYALTAEVLPQLRQRWLERAELPGYRERLAQRPGWKEAAEKVMTADSGTLGRVLSQLRARYGSPETWLIERGMEAGVVDALRARLLV
jgi:protein-tyrosine phosphatase